jgi:hypothetical protein
MLRILLLCFSCLSTSAPFPDFENHGYRSIVTARGVICHNRIDPDAPRSAQAF